MVPAPGSSSSSSAAADGAVAQSNPMLAGQWELTRTEGIDGFLATMGLSWPTRKVAAAALGRGRATVVVKLSPDGGTATLRLRQGEGKPWHEFDLVTDGVQRENLGENGKPEKNTARWADSGRLVQDNIGHRGKMTITRYLLDDSTLVAAICAEPGKAEMLRYYDRVGPVPPQPPPPTPSEPAAAAPPSAAAPGAAAPDTAAPSSPSGADPAASAAARQELAAFLTAPFVDANSDYERAPVGTGTVSETEGAPFTHTTCWERMVQVRKRGF
jgi:hypothetical protein|eukprot:COSAG06_NODE_3531_length_5224_cov_194.056585_5_plen_271_part_00